MSNLDSEDKRTLGQGLENRVLGNKVYDLLRDQGAIPIAPLNLATEPTALDTFTVGADVYQFQAAAGDLSDDSYIAVKLTGAIATTRDEVLAAVNATYDPDEHPTIFRTDSTTPALANGTEVVVAVENGTTIEFRPAEKPGGTARPGDPSIVLAEALTAVADVWLCGDVNMNTLGGQVAAAREYVVGSFAVTAETIASGFQIDLPWQPSQFLWSARLATGEHRLTANDLCVTNAAGLAFTFTGGGAPDVQATDVLTFTAWE